LAEVTNDDGTMARRPELERFAAEHGLVILTVADLVRRRRETTTSVRREAAGRVPTAHGEFTALTYRTADGVEHVALVHGGLDTTGRLARPTNGTDGPDAAVLVRVHSECLTGDVFGSRRCDCGEQLDGALERIAGEGRGVVIYLRGHEGRGIGLSHKLRAYTLQDGGLDTVDANLVQGLPIDSREYGAGAQILRDLGIDQVLLMTNNPAKESGLAEHGVRIVRREPLVTPPNPDNISYLTTKRVRMDHDLGGLSAGAHDDPSGGAQVS
jgi:3,4-dihydroxy 2-butanone 4-phosphate synthase/GTP cyclohydrolase II